MMTQLVKGKTVEEAIAIFEKFRKSVNRRVRFRRHGRARLPGWSQTVSQPYQVRHPRVAHDEERARRRRRSNHGVTNMPDRIDDPGTPQGTLTKIEKTMMEGDVIEAIRTVYDPEIPVNVYDLGLIYDVTVSEER